MNHFVHLSVIVILINSSLSHANTLRDFKLGGDFRYRHEYVKGETEAARHRQRIRGRLKLSAEVNEEIGVTLRLATGGSGSSSATSTNQTLDDGFANKEMAVDQLYAKWQGSDQLSVFAGKMANPLFRPNKVPLVWDGDVTPEGLALQYSAGPETSGLFLNVSSFWLDERSAASDAGVVSVQFGYNVNASAHDSAKLGVGHASYINVKGHTALNGKSAGNSVDINDNYRYGYEVVEGFAQYSNSQVFPLSVGALFINNAAVDEDNQGYAVSISIGDTKKQGWNAKYSYLELQKDATLGVFTDSDVFESGTNAKGHIVQASHRFGKNVKGSLTYFMTEFDLDQPSEQNKAQLDLIIGF